MKLKLPVFISLLSFTICNAQVAPPPPGDNATKKQTLSEVQEMPDFPGGTPELIKFIKQNIKVPEYITKNNKGGKVFLKFIVNPDGSLSDIKVTLPMDGCKECGDEAVRVVKSMPNWTPGKQNGKAVPVSFNLPIKFSK
jgi:protein TonB